MLVRKMGSKTKTCCSALACLVTSWSQKSISLSAQAESCWFKSWTRVCPATKRFLKARLIGAVKAGGQIAFTNPGASSCKKAAGTELHATPPVELPISATGRGATASRAGGTSELPSTSVRATGCGMSTSKGISSLATAGAGTTNWSENPSHKSEHSAKERSIGTVSSSVDLATSWRTSTKRSAASAAKRCPTVAEGSILTRMEVSADAGSCKPISKRSETDTGSGTSATGTGMGHSSRALVNNCPRKSTKTPTSRNSSQELVKVSSDLSKNPKSNHGADALTYTCKPQSKVLTKVHIRRPAVQKQKLLGMQVPGMWHLKTSVFGWRSQRKQDWEKTFVSQPSIWKSRTTTTPAGIKGIASRMQAGRHG